VVTANLQLLQGTFAAWSTEIAWLPAVYVMTNVSINLLLVKFRQQFGLRAFTEGFLVLYVLVTFFHLFVNDLSSALMVRAAHGMVAAALSSLGIYYQVQAWPARHRLKALTIGITGSSLAIPLARLFSTELLQIDEWRGLYFFELGLALVSLACVIALKLPPSDRKKVFEKKDFITFFLLAPGMALVTAVLSLGRLDWWFEAPWIGWALAGAVVLIVSAIAFEHNRSNPLLNIKWLSSGSILRLGLIMLLIRIVLAEQNTGVIGWLQYVGLQNEQMTNLAWSIFAGIVCGIVASCLTLNPQRLYWPTATALALIMVASLLDSQSTILTPGAADVQPVSAGLRQRLFPRPGDAGGDWRRHCRPAQPGELLGAVRHEPEYRRPAGLRYSRHFPDLAGEVSLQPARRPAHHAQSADYRAFAAVQPDVSKPDWRQHPAQRSGHHAAAKRRHAAGQYSGLQ
jgi:MFS family permease